MFFMVDICVNCVIKKRNRCDLIVSFSVVEERQKKLSLVRSSISPALTVSRLAVFLLGVFWLGMNATPRKGLDCPRASGVEVFSATSIPSGLEEEV